MLKNRWALRGLIAAVLLVWFALGGVGGATIGKLGEVQENDNAAFLPASAESSQAAAAHRTFVPSDAVPGLFVVDGVTSPQDLADVQAFIDEVVERPLPGDEAERTVGDVLTAPAVVIPSADGEAALVVFNVSNPAFAEQIGEDPLGLVFANTVRDAWTEQELATDGYLTGAVGIVADLVEAFAGIDGILLGVALGVVLVILLVVYRSPSLPFIVLLTAVFALSAAVLVVYQMAKSDVIDLNGQSQGIMFILVVGAATDYSLLLVARFREELRRTQEPIDAMATAWRRSLGPIAASAGTVGVALLCLLLSDLSSNAALGPAGAIGIAAAFIASLTLLPALLLIAGKRSRAVFWPSMPHYRGAEAFDDDHVEAVEARAGFWGKVSKRVAAHPRRTWIVSAAALLALAAFVPTLKADGLSEQQIFLSDVDSILGVTVLEEHFAAGESAPMRVIVPEVRGEDALAAVVAVEGIETAYFLTPAVAAGAPGGVVPEDPIIVNGLVEIEAITAVSSTSPEAVGIAADVREAVGAVTPDALVGGQAAESLDTNNTTGRDLRVLVPTILTVIFIVLALLLRSLVAPLIIVAANVVSFAATLGLSAIVFNGLFKFPGADPGTPLLAFVFLVALGVDYSIFLMSRVREEALKHGTRDGVRHGVAVTGGVITSAGIVLAATFAALGVLPLIFLLQIAFIVGVGVLIDTFVVRTLLVPGVVYDLGRRAWWPMHAGIRD